jgi:hypothetical protein
VGGVQGTGVQNLEVTPVQGEGVAGFGVQGGAGPSDPFFSSVQALLHMDGVNNGTVFTDSSSVARAFAGVSLGSNVPITVTSQFKFGTASAFIANPDWPRIRTLNNTGLHPGAGDFTLEGWIRLDVAGAGLTRVFSNYAVEGSANTAIAVTVSTTNRLQGTVSIEGGSTVGSVQSAVLSDDTWYFVSFVRSSGDICLYVDGVATGAVSSAPGALRAAADTLVVGGAANFSFPLYGWADDIRYTVGVARYTGNFTPPTSAFPNF